MRKMTIERVLVLVLVVVLLAGCASTVKPAPATSGGSYLYNVTHEQSTEKAVVAEGEMTTEDKWDWAGFMVIQVLVGLLVGGL